MCLGSSCIVLRSRHQIWGVCLMRWLGRRNNTSRAPLETLEPKALPCLVCLGFLGVWGILAMILFEPAHSNPTVTPHQGLWRLPTLLQTVTLRCIQASNMRSFIGEILQAQGCGAIHSWRCLEQSELVGWSPINMDTLFSFLLTLASDTSQ